MKKINSLTSFRFLFAVMIFLSHLGCLSGSALNGGIDNIYDKFFNNSVMAVYFFFIVSGFGLTYKYHNTEAYSVEHINLKNLLAFVWKRIKKIYPLYIITILICVPMQVHNNIVDGVAWYSIILKLLARLILGFSLIQSAFGLERFSFNLNRAGWFLSALAILYFIYPILERLNAKYINTKKKAIVAFCICFVLRLVFYVGFTIVEEYTFFDTLVYSSPYSRIFDFVLGMLLCNIFWEVKKDSTAKSMGGGTLIELLTLLSVIAWWLCRNAFARGQYNELKNIVDITLVLLLIYVFAFEYGKVSEFFGKKMFVVLGSCAMYIYLIHYCLIMNFNYWLAFTTFSTGTIAVITVVGVTVLTIIGVLLCYYINRKFQFKNKQRQ